MQHGHGQEPRRKQSGPTEAPVLKKEFLYKVLVVGNMGAGKTSIIKRYCDNEFSDNYKSTIGVDFALKSLEWGNNTLIHLQMWDIAGQERYGNLTRVYYRDAVAAFVVLDLGRELRLLQESLDVVKKWKDDIDAKVQLPNGDPLPVVLLANKYDLVADDAKPDDQMIESFAKENGFIGWFYTSAKANMNVDQSVSYLINHIVQNVQSGPQAEQGMHLTLNESEIQKYGRSESVCC